MDGLAAAVTSRVFTLYLLIQEMKIVFTSASVVPVFLKLSMRAVPGKFAIKVCRPSFFLILMLKQDMIPIYLLRRQPTPMCCGSRTIAASTVQLMVEKIGWMSGSLKGRLSLGLLWR